MAGPIFVCENNNSAVRSGKLLITSIQRNSDKNVVLCGKRIEGNSGVYCPWFKETRCIINLDCVMDEVV